MAKKSKPQLRSVDSKIDEYLHLMSNPKKLRNSSKILIRKKHSPLARSIAKGNTNAIQKAVRDVYYGRTTPEQRKLICEKINSVKKKFKDISSSKIWRELLAALVLYVISLVNGGASLIFSLLWIIRGELYKILCQKKDLQPA